MNEEKILDKIKVYLNLPNFVFTAEKIQEKIKEICTAKLCIVVGINCDYNYKNEYFNIFSTIMGEALCQKLSCNLHIANEELRFVKYEHINFVEKVVSFLANEDVDEAFLDAFNFIDENKEKLKKII